MTAPTENQNLQRLVTALAYANNLQAVREALSSFPDITDAAVSALLAMGSVRQLIRAHPRVTDAEPVQAMYRHNLMRRAAYLASAGRRLTTAVRGLANGRFNRMRDAVDREKQYLSDHLNAAAKRVQASVQVAEQAALQQMREQERTGVDALISGPTGVIGWYATLDERTSPECRLANGRNFDPKQIPLIGFPGAVHPHCRCRPGPPHPSGLRVEDLSPDHRARARTVLDNIKGLQTAVAMSRYSADSGWRVRSGTL